MSEQSEKRHHRMRVSILRAMTVSILLTLLMAGIVWAAFSYTTRLPASVSIVASEGPGLSVVPGSFDFGELVAGDTNVRFADVTNIGDIPLTNVWANTEDRPTYLSFAFGGGGPLLPGETITVQLWLTADPDAPPSPPGEPVVFGIYFVGDK